MAEFVSLDEKVEVLGGVVISLLEGMGVMKERATGILKKNGIADIKADGWYPLQAYLDSLKELGDGVLKQIGSKIFENAVFPPHIDDIVKAYSSIDMAYHMNHRNGNIGNYKFEMTGEKTGKMTTKNPYPCAFDEGLLLGIGRKFAPKGSFVKIEHNEKDCKKTGNDICIYNIKW